MFFVFSAAFPLTYGYKSCAFVRPLLSVGVSCSYGSPCGHICLQEVELDITETFDQKMSISGDWKTQDESDLAGGPKKRRRPGGKKTFTYDELVTVAKTFAELYPDQYYDQISCPIPTFNSSSPRIIIECPTCLTPAKTVSSSAFLKLLQHFSRRHPQSMSALTETVSHTYSSYIEHMQTKIAVMFRRRYKRKLRGRVYTVP